MCVILTHPLTLWYIEAGCALPNNYFKYLIDRYNGSPTNNAIINGISQMIYGRGLDALNSNKKPDQYAQMISLLKKDMVRKVMKFKENKQKVRKGNRHRVNFLPCN